MRGPALFCQPVLGWPECTAITRNREEAIERTRRCLVDLLAEAEIVQLDIDLQTAPSAWARFAGIWADDETFDDFLALMQANRRQVDADESQPQPTFSSWTPITSRCSSEGMPRLLNTWRAYLPTGLRLVSSPTRSNCAVAWRL